MCFLMRRRPPRSTSTDTLFPPRRSSDLQDVAGHRHFPGDGVAQRYMLNRFVLAGDNLGCCPEGPDDAIDLRFLIIDDLDAWVRRSATRDLNRMGSRKGCKRDENRSDRKSVE